MVKNEGFVEKFPKILPSYLHCLVKKGNLNLLVPTLFKNNPLKTKNKLVLKVNCSFECELKNSREGFCFRQKSEGRILIFGRNIYPWTEYHTKDPWIFENPMNVLRKLDILLPETIYSR